MTIPAEWERLRALFEGALQQPPHCRAAFLREHSRDDERLRCEVESLLVAHEGGERFLDQPLIQPPPAGSDDLPHPGDSELHAARLAIGTQLGAFEIVELLGIGGMGEVYRARDTRLDRLVGIKVLSSRFDIDTRSRERFEREARAISKLSHPHICTVHDVGSAELGGIAVPYFVMELLDGETLAARIERAPLPLDLVLTYAIDIADALAAAHGRGVVHRDLKPANVMVTSAGVKLLDFGLAQLRTPEPASPESAADAAHLPLTTAGMVFGTLPYMSPEQLRGERVDARTDIFACGALLHEMLTGRRPFAGVSQAAVIAAILEHDTPSVSEGRPAVPATLDHVVRKCLSKNPEDRWQTARDLRTELQWIAEGLAAPHPALSRRIRHEPRSRLLRFIPSGVLAVALAILVSLLGWRLLTPHPPGRVVTHLSLNFPPEVTLDIPINGRSFTVSPDGSRVAYVGVRGGRKSLFVQALNTGVNVEIADAIGASNPAFSPDSQWLAFVQSGSVRKLPVTGGPSQVVCACPAPHLRWLSDGRMVRSALNRPIQEVAEAPRSLTRLAEGDEAHHTPVLMANGSMLITVLRGGWQSAVNSVAVWAPQVSAARELVPRATSAEVVGGDTIVYAQGPTFFAARLDAAGTGLAGQPRAIDLRVQTTAYSVSPMYAVSANGTLVYADPAAGRRLVWVDRHGREEFVNSGERMYGHLRISPDGTRVATYQPDGDRDIWVFGLDRPTVEKLTSGPARDAMPVWSNDGARIFFTTGENKVRSIAGDGSGAVLSVFDGHPGERIHPLSVSPDGTQMVVQWDTLPLRIDQRVLRLGAPTRLEPLVGDSGSERDGRLSPDGRWLAFQSDEAAQGQEGHITVRPFPDVHTHRWVISAGLGRQPVWSRDGRELFYRTEDGTVMSVPVQTTPSFAHGAPTPVVTPLQTLRDWGGGPTYDVSLDGRRFLFIKAPELNIRSLHVVLNWDVEVKSKLAGSD